MKFNCKFKKKTVAALALAMVALGSVAGVPGFNSPAKAEEVYLLRGFLNVFSGGMNEMAGRLRVQGIHAQAISADEWGRVASSIIARKKTKKISYPIIIAGHSLGGLEAVNFANTLGRAGIPVALVIGIDPGFNQPNAFRSGTKKVINYRVNGQYFRAGSGFSGSIRNVSVASYGSGHTEIDKNGKLQSQVINNIKSSVGK